MSVTKRLKRSWQRIAPFAVAATTLATLIIIGVSTNAEINSYHPEVGNIHTSASTNSGAR